MKMNFEFKRGTGNPRQERLACAKCNPAKKTIGLQKQKIMEVICLQDEAFYALIEQVVERIKEKQGISHDKWISPEEAMQKLRISSKTTLQKLRDIGAVRFSQPAKKIILYDVDSIEDYLQKHSKETF